MVCMQHFLSLPLNDDAVLDELISFQERATKLEGVERDVMAKPDRKFVQDTFSYIVMNACCA